MHTLAFTWTQDTKPVRTKRKAVIHVHPNREVEEPTPEGTSLKDAKQALLRRARWVTERHVKLIRGQIQVTGKDLDRERVKADLRA